MVSERDLGWIAGFLEGEGSFTFHVTCLKISAAQVQRSPLDKLRLLMGGTICMKPRVGKAPYYQWQLASTASAGWMMTLYALMSARRQGQISDALAIWKTRKRKGWRKDLTHCKRGHEFTPENTMTKPKGGRNCRICLRMLWNRRRGRKVVPLHPHTFRHYGTLEWT